jgi:hypothetical protein
MADDYLIRVTTVDRDTVRVALEGSYQLLHQVLTTLLEGGNSNGAAPPSAHARVDKLATLKVTAKPPRRQYKRRGRPKKADHHQGSHAKVETGPVQPLLESRCSFCANPFTTPYTGTKFCSADCKRKSHQLQPLPRPLEAERAVF